jgi:hypothetical protein
MFGTRCLNFSLAASAGLTAFGLRLMCWHPPARNDDPYIGMTANSNVRGMFDA